MNERVQGRLTYKIAITVESDRDDMSDHVLPISEKQAMSLVASGVFATEIPHGADRNKDSDKYARTVVYQTANLTFFDEASVPSAYVVATIRNDGSININGSRHRSDRCQSIRSQDTIQISGRLLNAIPKCDSCYFGEQR